MYNFLSKINNNIYAKIGAIALLCVVFFTFIFILFVKYFISYSYIENKIENITGLKIELTKPQSNFDFKFNLNTKAQELNIYNKDKTIKFLTIKNPNITFKPIGLLFNKAYFKNISADDIKINAKRNPDGKIDLIEVLNKDFNKLLNKNIILTRLEGNIKNTDITFSDNFQTNSIINLNLKNTNVSISKRKKYLSINQIGTIKTIKNNIEQISYLNLNIHSKYPFNKTTQKDLKVNINLDNLNLYIFNDLAKKYISNEINSFEGSANLAIQTQNENQKLTLNVTNPTIKLKDKKTISPFKNNILLEGFFDIQKNELNFKDLKIQAKDLFISSNGKIANIFKKPNIELNVDFKDTQINNLIPFIPDNAIFYRPKGIPTLKKSNFFGLAQGNLNIKAYPLNIEGNLKVKDVHIPNYPKPYKQNDVNARFMGDKVRIYTRIYTPDNEYVLVDGISNLDDSLWGKYSVKSTSRIDLAYAQMYLVPIQQIIGFNIGPVPIMDISGFGNINISTQGTINDAQIFGTFNAYNSNAEIEGLSAKLTNGKCSLIFKDRDLIFKEIKGKLDEADFLLEGKGNTKGEVNLNAKITNAKTDKVLKIFNNSIITNPYANFTKQIKTATGDFSADINLNGKIKDYENPDFFKSLLLSGILQTKNNNVILNNNLELKNLSGILNFGLKQKGQFKFNLNNSIFSGEFASNDNLSKISTGENFNIQASILSNKIAFSDITQNLSKLNSLKENQRKILEELSDINFYSKLSLKTQGLISLSNINPENLKFSGYLLGLNSTKTKDVKFNSGIIKINNNKLTLDNFDANIKAGKIKGKGNISSVFSKTPVGDMALFLENIELDKISEIIPKIKSSNIKINNGQIFFKNNNLKLNAMSLNYASTPIFLNAVIKDIYNGRIFDSNFSTIIDENSADNIINPYLISPFKITGEVPLKGTFKGNLDNYSIDFSAIFPKNSDISFNGANLGDINHKRELSGNINVSNNVAKIHNLKLIKYIANQNNKINPITTLKASGQIVQKDNSFFYNDFKIATNTPINVRILNLIFKKSILKKGNFDCNISLSGNIKLPKINGKFNLYDLDIPLYNTKVDNIKASISNNFIDGEILAKNKQSDLKIKLHALNKLIAPYVVKDVIISSDNFNIDEILSDITPTQTKTDITPKTEFNVKPEDIVVEKGSFNFKDVQYDKISAQNIKGNLNYKNNIVNIKNMMLDIAQGVISANGNYDIKTTKLKLEAQMSNCDSNILTKDFLKLPNQIFGKIDGTISLSGKKLHTYDGINSIKSNIDFSIDNGKMPKLGSLEYLLRAGNLFKNGIMGLSLNNLIEVLTPYKTGEFEKISGKLSIANGEIETLNIFSKGKNLSLFLDGNYSILENFADIKIYGKLSQNISNALGAVGNASINQLVEALTQAKRNKNEKNTELQNNLDKIPPIESQSSEPRYFKARVLGDINKENYIKSFNWI